MTRYNKRIMYCFIDETDDGEDTYRIIGSDWPNKVNYYKLYRDTSNYKSKSTTTFKNSYLNVVLI